MNRIIILLLSTVLFTVSCTQKHNTQVQNILPKTDYGTINFADGAKPVDRLFPDKLRDLPNEIIAAHYPNPCYATYEDSMYIWKHNTTIQAKEDLQIVEYGSFVYTEKGWYLRVTMSPDEFAANYNCKGGLLKKGKVYTDNASWRRDKKLRGGDAMWYYIAKDKNGRLVKGTAPIETEGKLLNTTTRSVAITQAKISWTGYGEIGNYSLTGTINLKKGDALLSGDTLKTALVIFDMPSITHTEKTLETHLKGEDFFDVRKFPEAIFETENIQYTSSTSAVAKGNLTIKGITKPMAIPLQISRNDKEIMMSGKIAVDRTLFGIKYNSKSFFGDLGDQAIQNKFDLTFSLKVL